MRLRNLKDVMKWHTKPTIEHTKGCRFCDAKRIRAKIAKRVLEDGVDVTKEVYMDFQDQVYLELYMEYQLEVWKT